MKRLSDIILALVISIPLSFVFIFLWATLRISAGKPTIYWSERVGKNNKLFRMPKLRTMKLNTPQVATHLLDNPGLCFIRGGEFLRKTSLDEIPQLYCILKGDMSFVGPRPALFNQDDLIKLRTEKNIHKLLPGLTGWAQVNGRDDLSIPEKVKLDAVYLQRQGFLFDLEILFKTIWRVAVQKDVSH